MCFVIQIVLDLYFIYTHLKKEGFIEKYVDKTKEIRIFTEPNFM